MASGRVLGAASVMAGVPVMDAEQGMASGGMLGIARMMASA
jgi:hypothetical protein